MHKKHRYSAIPLEETKKLLPAFLLGNGATLLGTGIYGLFFSVDWTLFVGAAAGSAVSLANFYLMAYYAAKTIATEKRGERARVMINASYGIRYIAMFLILGAMLWLGAANPVTLLAPLFFPRLSYLIQARDYKDENEEKP